MLGDRVTNHVADYRSNAIISVIIGIVFALRRSFFLSLTALGIVLLIYGSTMATGVVAGMMGIWGGTLVILGGGVYSLMWIIRYYLRERKLAADTRSGDG